MFKIEINTDNEAFTDSASEEIARILDEISKALKRNPNDCFSFNLFDVNGNRVGVCWKD